MEITKVSKLNKKFSAMKNEAAEWETSWEDIKRWECPARGRFDQSEVNEGTLPDYQDIINGRIQTFVRTFADGMYAGMTNPVLKWFKIELEDEDLKDNYEVKIWLEKAEDLIDKIFAKSNVYDSLRSMYEELGLFATTCAIINDDFEDVIRLRNFTVGEYYLANDYSGRVNSMAREFTKTVAQLVEEFGADNVSADVKNSFDNGNFDKKVIVRNLICPREQYDDSKKDNLNMPFADFYWEKGSSTEDVILSESGHKRFPVIATRWNLISSADIYGNSSPGWLCLGDAKEIQVLEQDKLINLALIARTPMMVDSNIETYDLNPNGITYVDMLNGNNGVRPVDIIQADIQKIDASIKEIEQRMRETWYVDFFIAFLQNEGPVISATETLKRDSEKKVGLSSVLTKINNEALKPLIENAFDKILEDGLIEEPPEIMQDREWKINFISSIAQAQKMIGTSAIEQGAAFVGNLSAVFPTVIDNFDSDEAYRIYMEKLGLDVSISKPKPVVQQEREARAAAMAQQQQQEQASQMIQGAKVLSDTEIRPNTALTELVGN